MVRRREQMVRRREIVLWGHHKKEILSFLSSLVIFNGGLHVVVYFAMSSQIRQAVKKYFRGWLCLDS